MTQVNPHASTHVSGFSSNPTQPGSRRGVFWLVTACLFLSVAVLLFLERAYLWIIVLPLWFAPLIMSDMRAGARRADSRWSGANSSIDHVAKAIGIMFSIIVYSFISVVSIQWFLIPCRCADCLQKFEGVQQTIRERGVPDEQPVLPAHSLGDQ